MGEGKVVVVQPQPSREDELAKENARLREQVAQLVRALQKALAIT